MKNLTVRNVPEDVYRRLRVTAASKGMSLEAHLRETLAQAALQKSSAPKEMANEPFARVRAQIRKANGGKLPNGVTAAFLKERKKMWGDA
jgi:plasmid stability protein